MKSLIYFTIIFVLFLTVILPVTLTLVIRYIPSGVQPPLTNTKKIYGPFTLNQSFISPLDRLSGIGVSIKNPNFANKKTIYFNLLDEQNTVIRKVTLNGQNIADGKFVKIFFEEIDNSKDKRFTWSISSPDSVFEDAIEIFLTDKEPSWGLDLKANEEVSEQGLSYVTLHKPKNKFEVLERVFSGFVSKLGHDKFFLVSYLTLISIFSGLLLYLSLRKKKV